MPPAPAAAFENITRMSFDGPSNVAIDDIPLRLRPAVREETKPQKQPGKDIVEDSGVPRSWIEDKQRVDIRSKASGRRVEEKFATGADTPRHEEEIDADSDDTMQIKVSRSLWYKFMSWSSEVADKCFIGSSF